MEVDHSTYEQDHFKFSTVLGKPFFVPKKDLITWEDLLFELQDYTNFQFNWIEVAINNKKVFYPKNTKLVDIGIKKSDSCIALLKKKHKNDKEAEIYNQKVKECQEYCCKLLQEKLESDEDIRLSSLMESNQDYLNLFNEFGLKYGKMETMLTIQKCQGHRSKVIEMLASGEAETLAVENQNKIEKQFLREYLNTSQSKAIKKFLKENKADQNGYRKVIQKLYAKNDKFRQYEPKHQTLVRKQLLDLPYLDSDNEEDEPQVNPLVKQVFELVESIKKEKERCKLSEKDKKQLMNQLKKEGAKDDDAKKALGQSNNQIQKAVQVVKGGLVPKVEKLSNFVKRSSRINIVLQFFAQPQFQHIVKRLKGNKQKAQRFVEWVISQNEDNSTLVKLIARYNDYAITYLSGEYCIQKPQKLEHGELKFDQPLALAKQKKLRMDVEAVCSIELVGALKKAKVEEKLAVAVTKASKNEIQEMKPYLQAGRVNIQFDFCPQNTKTEQIFLFKKWRKEKDLLKKLRNEKEQLLWLSQLSVLRPFMFDIIVRNKLFWDRLVAGQMNNIKK